MGNGFVGWFSRSYKGIIVALVAVMAAALTVLAMQHVSVNASATGATPRPAPTYSAAPERSRAVFIGDSYTAGAGSSNSATNGFVPLLAKDRDWIAINEGRGGTGYTQEITGRAAPSACGLDTCPNYGDMIAAAAAKNPDIVMVSGGRNDAAVPEVEEAAAIRQFYADLREALPNAKIYATEPLWDNTAPPASLVALRNVVSDAVTAADGTYLKLSEPLAGRGEFISADKIHPNDAGHQAIADAIDAALE